MIIKLSQTWSHHFAGECVKFIYVGHQNVVTKKKKFNFFFIHQLRKNKFLLFVS